MAQKKQMTEKIYCTNCGKEVAAANAYCQYCGHRLKTDIKESEHDINEQNDPEEEYKQIIALQQVKQSIMLGAAAMICEIITWVIRAIAPAMIQCCAGMILLVTMTLCGMFGLEAGRNAKKNGYRGPKRQIGMLFSTIGILPMAIMAIAAILLIMVIIYLDAN